MMYSYTAFLLQIATETLKEGTTGYIDLIPTVPPKFLCNSMVSGTVHVEAVLKRKKYYDYFCWSEYRPIAQAVFSPVDATNAACGAMMDNTALTSGKPYRINVRPKDDRRREWWEYTRTVSLHVVKMNGGNEVCRQPLGDISVSLSGLSLSGY